MATFSKRFPRAVHVFPLHALRSIAETGALLGKAHLRQQRTAVLRRTTSHTDVALGLRSLFVVGATAVLLLFVGIHNAWDAVVSLALQRPQGPDKDNLEP
jgi:hypothetical protein